MPKVRIELEIGQAKALAEALDFFSRISIGQLQEVASLVRHGVVPLFVEGRGERAMADAEVCDQVHSLMLKVKAALGYPKNGSHGIGHPHVCQSGLRAYELKKVLDQALAIHGNPNPEFRGVQYDGLGPVTPAIRPPGSGSSKRKRLSGFSCGTLFRIAEKGNVITQLAEAAISSTFEATGLSMGAAFRNQWAVAAPARRRAAQAAAKDAAKDGAVWSFMRRGFA